MVLPRLDLGGMERTVLAQASALRRRGVDVHLVALQPGGPLVADAMARGLPLLEGRDITGVRRAVAFLEETSRRLHLTHVHSHTGTWWPAARAARRVGVPHLHTRHGFVEAQPWRTRITEWLAARDTQAVVCVSELLRQHALQALRVPASRALLLRNGIEFDRALETGHDSESPDRETLVGYRQAESSGTPSLALVCRLAAVKNVPLAVRVLARLQPSWPSLSLHIVGDGPARHAIEATADALGVRDALVLHGAHDAPWSQIPADAIVLQSSDSEGLSLSLIEALARGHRVVATDVGETRGFCTDAPGVRIVPPANERGMAAAIDDMLRWAPDVVRAMTDANRAHAHTHGSLDVVIDALVALYDRTASRH